MADEQTKLDELRAKYDVKMSNAQKLGLLVKELR